MMFLYLCNRVAYATGEITTAVCGTGTQEFPLPATAMTTPDATWLWGTALLVTSQHAIREEAENPLPIEDNDPTRPGGWRKH